MANKFYNNLVSHWLMNDDEANTDVLDNKGSNDGVLTNAGNTEDASVEGKINKALDFDGVDDKVVINGLNYVNATEWSLSVWVKKDTYVSGSSIYSDYSGSNRNIQCGYETTENLMKFYCGSGVSAIYVAVADIFIADEWAHWAFVYKGSTYMRIYKNGELVAERTTSIPATIAAVHNETRFGVNYATAYFDGKMDDARIYNTAITEDYIKLLYNAGAGTEDENIQHHNLVSHWLLNDDLATTAVLDTTGVNNGTLEGGNNTEDLSVAGKINKALELNGIDDWIYSSAFSISGDVSFSVWFKANSFVSWAGVIGDFWRANYFGFVVIPYNSTTIRIAAGNGEASYEYHNWTVSDMGNSWHHIVAVHESGVFKIYLDGEHLSGDWTQAVDHSGVSSLFCGRWNSEYDGYYFDGLIDEARCYNTAISAYYIKLLYNNGAGTEDENVQSNTLLLGCNF